MKITRTDLTPGMAALLVVIAVPLILIALTILIAGALVGVIVWAVTGISPVSLFRRKRERRRGDIFESPFGRSRDVNVHDAGGTGNASSADDSTIECEVISARTVEADDNGPR